MEKLRIQKHVPFLEAVVGPMFSSKSTELDRRLTNIDYYNKYRVEFCNGTEMINYIILRPSTDNRPAVIRPLPYQKKNHCQVNPSDIFLSASGEELDLLNKYDYIILDEAQFFSSDVIDQVKTLLEYNKYVIVAGLDKDYRGEPFSEFMKWVLCVADDVTKLTAICVKCGRPSTMAKLTTDDPSEVLTGNIIIEDEHHHYVPMCRRCMRGDR